MSGQKKVGVEDTVSPYFLKTKKLYSTYILERVLSLLAEPSNFYAMIDFCLMLIIDRFDQRYPVIAATRSRAESIGPK